MRVHLAAGLLAVAAAGGCYASAGYSAGYEAPPPPPPPTYTATATVSVDTYQPDLVDVGGGVRVIADYDEPIFYTDNFYWRFYGGTWYRSSVYNSGWVVYNDVPYSVRRIDRPQAYVRYRPAGYVPRRERRYEPPPGQVVRDHRTGGGYERAPADRPPPFIPADRGGSGYGRPAPAPEPPVVRDHRTGGGYERAPAPAPEPPVVRDHRTGGGYERAPAPAPEPPVVRDHRADPGRPAPAPPASAPPASAPPARERREERHDDRPVVRDHRR
jgi:hypothetical protein